jgi:hypothetical protein
VSVVTDLGIGEPLRKRMSTSRRNWKDGGILGVDLRRKKLSSEEKDGRCHGMTWMARRNMYAYVATSEGRKARG